VAAVPQDDLDVDDLDVGDPDRRSGDVRRLPRVLTDTVGPWIGFLGPGRLLGAAGVALVLGGIAWWMLRAPPVPTESRLPLAARAEAAQVVTSVPSGGPSPPVAAPPLTTGVVVIHVTGAVQAPGVYELQTGQRVADAIDAAGGALADADPEALNLAAPVADGDRIAVPAVGETSALAGSSGAGHTHAGASGVVAAGSPVDLNTASVTELETLPGIGPATAAAIVDHRDQHGPYASVDDLEAVRGIGPAKLEAIRDHVTV
jgi:competence protein ComEA